MYWGANSVSIPRLLFSGLLPIIILHTHRINPGRPLLSHRTRYIDLIMRIVIFRCVTDFCSSFIAEISRVRHDLFSPSNFLLSLPPQNGPIVKLTEKIYAPVKEYPKVSYKY